MVKIRLPSSISEVIREKVPDADLKLMKLDTSSLESVRQFAAEFLDQENRLDILILNAGIRAPLERTITDDGLELTMATNHYGHFLLTMLLLDLIIRSQPSRIVVVSSTGHLLSKIDLQDTTYENKGHYKSFLVYCDSKLANVLFAKALAKKLSGTGTKLPCSAKPSNNKVTHSTTIFLLLGVTTYALHPGAVRTEIMRDAKGVWTLLACAFRCCVCIKNPKEGAQTTIHCAVDEKLAHESGKYYQDCKPARVNKLAKNEKLVHDFYQHSLEVTKAHDPMVLK
ncbi:unnamed protein product [Cyprideis torosa]|uniref:Uncharacterized protein n=1 Tax=Cyprideis torosa TaxID=163714 RepID=A0A7R8VZV1_9CRUS|nr:unnamed protein product [Cyprideis torosa]CAG0879054.1 unnamed protein product [Cyprideis torosa]